MAKVLKITKQDKTVHIAPISQKSFHESFNKRLPASKRAQIEVVDEEEVKNHPWRDETFINAAEAQKKASQLVEVNQAQAEEITRLKQLLAEKGQSTDAGAADQQQANTATGKRKAEDVIDLIGAATKPEEIDALIAGDERKSVVAAAEKRKTELAK